MLDIWKDMAQKQGGIDALSQNGQRAPGLLDDKALVCGTPLEQQLVQQASCRLAHPSLVQVRLNLTLESADNICGAHYPSLQNSHSIEGKIFLQYFAVTGFKVFTFAQWNG